MPSGWLVPVLYALVCLIWGSTWVVIKIGLNGVPPFLSAGLRFVLSCLLLFGLIAWRRSSLRLDRGGKIAVFSCGILGFSISYACVYWAEQYIPTGLTAMLHAVNPMLVALLSHFWARSETLTVRKIGGILIGMAGTVLLFKPAAAVSGLQAAGVLMVLAACAASSVNLIIIKKYAYRTDIYALNAWGMAIGAINLIVASFLTESYVGLAWTRANVLAVVYLGLFGSVVAFLCFYYLIKVMEATRLSVITLIFPVVAVVLGGVFLGEKMSGLTWLGMATVLAGAAFTLAPEKAGWTVALPGRFQGAVWPRRSNAPDRGTKGI